MKKKTKKPRRIEMGVLKAKADRAMQDHFRSVLTNCELCGEEYQVAHHFIFKSQSNYLRYEIKNLIFICQKCHYKFHNNYAQTMVVKVVRLRGQEWADWIEDHKRLPKSDNRKELEEIISKYSIVN